MTNDDAQPPFRPQYAWVLPLIAVGVCTVLTSASSSQRSAGIPLERWSLLVTSVIQLVVVLSCIGGGIWFTIRCFKGRRQYPKSSLLGHGIGGAIANGLLLSCLGLALILPLVLLQDLTRPVETAECICVPPDKWHSFPLRPTPETVGLLQDRTLGQSQPAPTIQIERHTSAVPAPADALAPVQCLVGGEPAVIYGFGPQGGRPGRPSGNPCRAEVVVKHGACTYAVYFYAQTASESRQPLEYLLAQWHWKDPGSGK